MSTPNEIKKEVEVKIALYCGTCGLRMNWKIDQDFSDWNCIIVEECQHCLSNRIMCKCGHAKSQHSFFCDHDECDYCQCEDGFIPKVNEKS